MGENSFDIKALVCYIEKEYNLDKDSVFDIIELSVLKAASKNKMFTNDLYVKINRDDYSLHIYDKFVVNDEIKGCGIISTAMARRYTGNMDVTEGDIVDIEIPIEKLGRICARDSKSMILQKIKNTRNINISQKYKDRIGEIVNGVVSGFEKGNIIITVDGNIDVVMPRSEKIPSEKYKNGDVISCMIIKINEKQKHSPVVVSRACEGYVEAVMKKEISEIDDGVVEIVDISRNPGFRTKVSVKSNDPKVDPIGSCVGKGGIRIRNIMHELGGEKIDLVRYSENLYEYIKEAMSPIRTEITGIDSSDSTVTVVVSPSDYMNALGKSGKNVSLVSRLVGYRIHIMKSMESASFEEQKDYAIRTLSDIFDISLIDANIIVNAGFLTPECIAAEESDTFVKTCGLDEIQAIGIYAAAKTIVELKNGQG